MNLFDRIAFWKDWDDDRRTAAARLIGFAAAVVGAFLALSMISYLFHWKANMSGGQAAGQAGSFGYRTARLLICNWFGLGSFSFVTIFAAIGARLGLGKWKFSLLKTTLISLYAALVAAIAFAFVGSVFGMDYVFGGGLGGRCGAFISNWAVGQIGFYITGACIVFLVLCIMFCCSSRFNRWFGGSAKPVDLLIDDIADIEPEPIPEMIPEPVLEPIAEPITEPIPEPVPEPVPEPAPTMEVVRDEDFTAEVVKDLKPIDNRLDPPDGLPRYKFPSLDILKNHASDKRDVSMDELNRNNSKIRTALANYRIEVLDVKAVVGPTVTLYKVYPAPGVQIAQIRRLQEDIAMSLNAKGVRVVTLSDSVGIEVANDHPSIVPVKALLNDEAYRNTKAELPLALGYTITQKVKIFDLADAPHLLIAGATKQGKSVCLNEIVTSLLFAKHPSELKFVFIDPKMVEFSAYARLLKHYLAVLPDAGDEDDEKKRAIVKNPKDAERILRSLTTEMDERYKLLSEAGVNNLALYNAKYKDRKLRPDKGNRYLPYIVTIVDEYADLTMSAGAGAETRASAKSITNSIIRLAQKGRAAGIHVILATQRPSVDVISGQIKANFPARIAFRVAQRIDSMTILDSPGADKLIGKGDMLFSAGIDMERLQCGLVDGDEIEELTKFIGAQNGPMKCYNTPYYLPEAEEAGAESSDGPVDMSKVDERFEEAARMVVMLQKGSTSALQTKLGMGFAKAARVMDQLEAAGIVGPSVSGGKPREVLVPDLDTLEGILSSFR